MRRSVRYAVLLVLMCAAWGTTLEAQENAALVIQQVIGEAQVKQGEGQWMQARVGMRLLPGMRVRTGGGGLVKASVGSDMSSLVTLRDGVMDVSEIAIAANNRKAHFMLHSGRIAAAVSGKYNNDFSVRTRTAVAGVRGTEYGVEYSDDEQSNVYVFRGKVDVQSLDALGQPRGQARSVAAGEKVVVRPTGEVSPVAPIAKPDENRFAMQVDKAPEKKDDGKKPDETKDDGKKDDGKKDGGTSRDGSAAPASGSGWSGSLGPVVIGDKTWTKMLLAPQFQLGKLTLALYVPIYYDANEPIWETSRWYNADEYDFENFGDFLHDILLKFRFIQYGSKGDEVFVKVGSIDDFVIGHGLIMNNYNNMLQFPSVRKIGLQLDLDFGAVGFESMMADVHETKIFGGRAYVRPFTGFLDRLAFGLSYVTDIRTAPDINNYATVFGTGIDFEFPLPSLGVLTWMVFADYATLGYKTTGTVGGKANEEIGFNGGHGWTYGVKGRLLFFKYQLAFRNLSGGFIPEYFDSYYDVERQARAETLIGANRSDFNGWLFETGFDLENVGYVKLNFQEYYGIQGGVATTDNKLTFGAELKKGVVPKFHAVFLYERTHVIGKELFDNIFGDNTVTTFSLFYEVSEGVEIVGTYRRFYEKGGGYTGSYSIETQMGL